MNTYNTWWMLAGTLPSGKLTYRVPGSNGKWTLWRCISYRKWWFSIAMFVYRRVATIFSWAVDRRPFGFTQGTQTPGDSASSLGVPTLFDRAWEVVWDRLRERCAAWKRGPLVAESKRKVAPQRFRRNWKVSECWFGMFWFGMLVFWILWFWMRTWFQDVYRLSIGDFSVCSSDKISRPRCSIQRVFFFYISWRDRRM